MWSLVGLGLKGAGGTVNRRPFYRPGKESYFDSDQPFPVRKYMRLFAGKTQGNWREMKVFCAAWEAGVCPVSTLYQLWSGIEQNKPGREKKPVTLR